MIKKTSLGLDISCASFSILSRKFFYMLSLCVNYDLYADTYIYTCTRKHTLLTKCMDKPWTLPGQTEAPSPLNATPSAHTQDYRHYTHHVNIQHTLIQSVLLGRCVYYREIKFYNIGNRATFPTTKDSSAAKSVSTGRGFRP